MSYTTSAGALAACCLVLGLAACDTSESACAACGASDAGGAPDPVPPKPCPVKRFCPQVKSVSSYTDIFLGDQNQGNVYFGTGVYTQNGPAVPWVTLPQLGSAVRRAGVALFLSGKIHSFDDQAPSNDLPFAPPLFERGDEIGLLVPAKAWNQVVRIPLDTFEAEPAVTLPALGPSMTSPGAVGVGEALAILNDPGPTLSFFDASLSERLVLLSHSDEGVFAALTPTCDGLVGTWMGGGGAARARSFDKLGEARSPIVDLETPVLPIPGPGPIWDGASVVLIADHEILELDNAARVVARTPEPAATAAVGTEAGVLVARVVQGQGQLVLLERGTGKVLQTLEEGFGAGDAVVATERYLYFVGTGGYNASTLGWVTVECSQ